MKKLFLFYVMSVCFGVTSSLLVADQYEHRSFCEECGTPVRADFISIYKPNGEVDRLLCKKCLKKLRTKKGKGSSSSSPSPSLFSPGSDDVFTPSPVVVSPLSPLSPLSPFVVVPAVSKIRRAASAPVTFFVDEKKAAELAEFLVEQRLKKGITLEENFLESYGQPTNLSEALSVKIRMFERLYEASKKPEEAGYSYIFHEARKCADIVDPQGNEHSCTTGGTVPFLWKRGGIFVFKDADALHIKDLEKGSSSSFPGDTLSLSILKEKCQRYGFEKVEPLTSYQEADAAHQAMLKRLPSPKFSS